MNSFSTLQKQRQIDLLAAKAYEKQICCWYEGLVSELVSLSALQSYDETTLRSCINLWAALSHVRH